MSPEEHQAQLLSQWLESPAGTAPPADVDPDVLEAIYALRPELAPAPSVSANDILSLVTEGPLAGPAPQSLGAVPHIPQPANQSNRRGWLPWVVGGASAVAAAALALLVVGPSLLTPGGLSPQNQGEVATFAEESAPSLDGAAQSEPSPGLAFGGEADKSENSRLQTGADLPPPPPEALAKADTQADAPQAEPAKVSREEAFSIGGLIDPDIGDAVAELGGQEAGAESPLADRDEMAEDKFDSELADDGALARAPAPAAGRAAQNSGPAPVLTEEVATVSRSTTTLDSVVGGRARDEEPRRKDREAKKEAKAKPEATASRQEPSEDSSAEQEKQLVDLATLERQARPSQPVAAETEAVQNLLGSGRYADARDSAKSLIQGGGLSNQRRADLHWVLGKAHVALGATAEARVAFDEAVRLRR